MQGVKMSYVALLYTMCRFDWSMRSKESSYCVKCVLINASSVNGEVTLQITG